MLQADFGVRLTVHGFATKGEQGGANQMWVTRFLFLYSRDGKNFIEYNDEFSEGKVSY